MTHRIPAGSPRLLRRLNASAVLRTIRADGPISRVELARVTGLSKPTVNGAVELLLDAGYLTERVAGLDARTRRSRPQARLLSFRGDFGRVLGIDIGANKVLVVVADVTVEVRGAARRRTRARERQTADSLLDFEHAAGGTASARLGRRSVAAGESPVLLELGGDPDAIDAGVVLAAADRGDKAAQRILDEVLQRLARGIASAVTILKPSTVIVGGGVSRAGARLLEPLERRIAGLVPVPARVVLSTLGDESVALGAARLALQAVEERLFDVAFSEAV